MPGKWRLIVDLSSPGGANVNDGIDPDEFTLHYITLNQVIHVVSKLGVRALMAKFDVEAAYCNLPEHPSHHVLLGMKGHDQFYLDMVLPFGLRSAPFIFNSIADMVEWILFLPDFRPPPLPGQLHYCRSPSVPSVRTELSYCYGSLSTAWSAFASWQVCGPLYGACCPRY